MIESRRRAVPGREHTIGENGSNVCIAVITLHDQFIHLGRSLEKPSGILTSEALIDEGFSTVDDLFKTLGIDLASWDQEVHTTWMPKHNIPVSLPVL